MKVSFSACLFLMIAVGGVSAQHGLRRPPKPPAPPPAPLRGPLALHASAWVTISTPSRFALINEASGALSFAFPRADRSMGYLYTQVGTRSLQGALVVTFHITAAAGTAFEFDHYGGNDGPTPANVRPFFWANHDGWGDDDRWWANPDSVTLAPGAFTLTVPLTGDHWSNVNGQWGNSGAGRNGFAAALGHISSLGVTFGGGWFFGHGVNVTAGSARFILDSLSVQ